MPGMNVRGNIPPGQKLTGGRSNRRKATPKNHRVTRRSNRTRKTRRANRRANRRT